MASIVLQFVGAGDPLSQAIEWFTQGDVSHVDAVLPDGYLLGARDDQVGGRPPGVQARQPGYASWGRVVRADLPAMNQDMVDLFYRLCQAEIGKPYDRQGILGFVAGRDWRTPDSWFCSELIGTMLERCGWFPYRLATPSNRLTPAGLLLACSARALVV